MCKTHNVSQVISEHILTMDNTRVMEKTANWKSLVSNEEEGQKYVQVTEQDKDLMSKVKTYEPTLTCQAII